MGGSHLLGIVQKGMEEVRRQYDGRGKDRPRDGAPSGLVAACLQDTRSLAAQ